MPVETGFQPSQKQTQEVRSDIISPKESKIPPQINQEELKKYKEQEQKPEQFKSGDFVMIGKNKFEVTGVLEGGGILLKSSNNEAHIITKDGLDKVNKIEEEKKVTKLDNLNKINKEIESLTKQIEKNTNEISGNFYITKEALQQNIDDANNKLKTEPNDTVAKKDLVKFARQMKIMQLNDLDSQIEDLKKELKEADKDLNVDEKYAKNIDVINKIKENLLDKKNELDSKIQQSNKLKEETKYNQLFEEKKRLDLEMTNKLNEKSDELIKLFTDKDIKTENKTDIEKQIDNLKKEKIVAIEDLYKQLSSSKNENEKKEINEKILKFANDVEKYQEIIDQNKITEVNKPTEKENAPENQNKAEIATTTENIIKGTSEKIEGDEKLNKSVNEILADPNLKESEKSAILKEKLITEFKQFEEKLEVQRVEAKYGKGWWGAFKKHFSESKWGGLVKSLVGTGVIATTILYSPVLGIAAPFLYNFGMKYLTEGGIQISQAVGRERGKVELDKAGKEKLAEKIKEIIANGGTDMEAKMAMIEELKQSEFNKRFENIKNEDIKIDNDKLTREKLSFAITAASSILLGMPMDLDGDKVAHFANIFRNYHFDKDVFHIGHLGAKWATDSLALNAPAIMTNLGAMAGGIGTGTLINTLMGPKRFEWQVPEELKSKTKEDLKNEKEKIKGKTPEAIIDKKENKETEEKNNFDELVEKISGNKDFDNLSEMYKKEKKGLSKDLIGLKLMGDFKQFIEIQAANSQRRNEYFKDIIKNIQEKIIDKNQVNAKNAVKIANWINSFEIAWNIKQENKESGSAYIFPKIGEKLKRSDGINGELINITKNNINGVEKEFYRFQFPDKTIVFTDDKGILKEVSSGNIIKNGESIILKRLANK